MKKYLALLMSVVMTACAFSSCGPDTADDAGENSEETTQAETEASADETEEDTAETEEIPEETEAVQSGRQICHKTIKNEEKPEVVKISFSAVCLDDIRKHAKVRDLFNIDVLHSGVVGLVGVPIELTYDEDILDPDLYFTYDKDELRGIPEKNLIMLHYSEDESFYNTVENAVLDTEKCTVSAEIYEEGVYLLADAYEWYKCWDEEISEQYAYEKDISAYPTDWERECDTGDIIKLADKEWAIENAPSFRVSSAEELASVVWYVNGVLDPNGFEGVAVSIEKDIDLTGYSWKPMGWSKSAFRGVVSGNGHTVTGMKISGGYEDSGFIGYGLGVTVDDINFVDADVTATGCTGIVGGQIYMSDLWTNINVSGKVSGGSEDYGAIIGREAGTTFKNCTADVTVDGESFEYLSYRQKREADVEIVETFTLTMDDDYTVTRDEHDGFRNLGWMILKDDVQVLHRNAENELSYQYFGTDPGDYTIYLVAYINGAYIRVSNIIKYTIS